MESLSRRETEICESLEEKGFVPLLDSLGVGYPFRGVLPCPVEKIVCVFSDFQTDKIAENANLNADMAIIHGSNLQLAQINDPDEPASLRNTQNSTPRFVKHRDGLFTPVAREKSQKTGYIVIPKLIFARKHIVQRVFETIK